MFNRKPALVTGSTSGIGLGEKLRAKLAAGHAVEVLYDGAELSQQDAIERMMGTATGEFGAVDILVNNAEIQFVAPIDGGWTVQ